MAKTYGYSMTINNPMPSFFTDEGVKIHAESDFVSALALHNMCVGVDVLHYIIGYEGGYTRESHRKNNFRELNGFKPLTPHLQCAIYFSKSVSFKKVKAIFPRAHIERLKMPYAAAWFYCKKEGCYGERGDLMIALEHDKRIRLNDPLTFPIGYDTETKVNPLEPIFDELGAVAKIHFGDAGTGVTN